MQGQSGVGPAGSQADSLPYLENVLIRQFLDLGHKLVHCAVGVEGLVPAGIQLQQQAVVSRLSRRKKGAV